MAEIETTVDRLSRQRKVVQWTLTPLVIVVIAFGWRYPLLGFSVPIVMLTGIIGSLVNGRYVCGHLCPRGGFYDRMVSTISPGKPIPQWIRSVALRWTLVVMLMGFMIYQIAREPGNIYHWGHVFWIMCTFTTAIGVVMALLIHQRSWCMVCPIGTMQNAIGGGKGRLQIDADLCRECKVCEKACPINLQIVKHKESGVLADRDCMRCPECMAKCPMGALGWEPNSENQTP